MVREISWVKKQKIKKVFQLTDEEFREGKWCSDREIVPEGSMVELTYTQRNGILIVHNTTGLDVKSIDDKSVMDGENEDD